jgi:hypothetical protein
MRAALPDCREGRTARRPASIRSAGISSALRAIEIGKAAPLVQMSVSRSSLMLALYSRTDFNPSRRPQAHRAVIFTPLSRASPRVSIDIVLVRNENGTHASVEAEMAAIEFDHDGEWDGEQFVYWATHRGERVSIGRASTIFRFHKCNKQ